MALDCSFDGKKRVVAQKRSVSDLLFELEISVHKVTGLQARQYCFVSVCELVKYTRLKEIIMASKLFFRIEQLYKQNTTASFPWLRSDKTARELATKCFGTKII